MACSLFSTLPWASKQKHHSVGHVMKEEVKEVVVRLPGLEGEVTGRIQGLD
ncbi:hypothetical protein CCACVL1_21084 [Corchorus capsularis]|uniref:Uncharacterized protein n=1 Tax=Corchorus capsularis TaxID=210143 RepID=A0A1R3H897_COCAP|nr:hypothetical protein CCACVL1_21084 [Corchorus capsularis]